MLFVNVNNLDRNVCSASIARRLVHRVRRGKKRTQWHNGEMPCDLLNFDKIPPNILNPYRDSQPVYFIWSLLSLRHPFIHSSIFPFFLSKFHDLRARARIHTHSIFAHSRSVCSSVFMVKWCGQECVKCDHTIARQCLAHTWHIDNLLNKTDFITQSFNLSGIIPCYVMRLAVRVSVCCVWVSLWSCIVHYLSNETMSSCSWTLFFHFVVEFPLYTRVSFNCVSRNHRYACYFVAIECMFFAFSFSPSVHLSSLLNSTICLLHIGFRKLAVLSVEMVSTGLFNFTKANPEKKRIHIRSQLFIYIQMYACLSLICSHVIEKFSISEISLTDLLLQARLNCYNDWLS